MQMHTSAGTSVNSTKLPKTFSFVKNWSPFTVNLDYGGGRFDNATKFLAGKNVRNLVYDPYNRSPSHNGSVLATLSVRKADTAMCNNVLNVVDSDDEVDGILDHIASLVKPGGTVYVKVYEGDRSGKCAETRPDCFQRNWKASEYTRFLERRFKTVARHGDIFVCSVG